MGEDGHPQMKFPSCNDASAVQLSGALAEACRFSSSGAEATPGSWLLCGKGVCDSFDCGPDDLPELTDEQFAHIPVAVTTDDAQTDHNAASTSELRKPSAASDDVLMVTPANLATSHPELTNRQCSSSRLYTQTDNSIAENRHFITDFVSASDSKTDTRILEDHSADGNPVIDLAPPAASIKGLHSLSAIDSIVAAAGERIPFLAGIVNPFCVGAAACRTENGPPLPAANRISTAAASNSPGSQSLRNSLQMRTADIPRCERQKIPCPPLPQRPLPGATTLPGWLPQHGSIQFSPGAASPQTAHSQDASPVAQSPQSLEGAVVVSPSRQFQARSLLLPNADPCPALAQPQSSCTSPAATVSKLPHVGLFGSAPVQEAYEGASTKRKAATAQNVQESSPVKVCSDPFFHCESLQFVAVTTRVPCSLIGQHDPVSSETCSKCRVCP